MFILPPEPVGYDGKTGGEVRMLKIIQGLNDSGRIALIIVSTERGAEYFRRNGILAEFKIIKTKLKFSSPLGLCLKSLFIVAKSFLSINYDFLKTKNEKVLIYSTSDLFWEVIPAFLHKTKNKKIEWVQIIHHIYPDWKKRAGNGIVNFFGYYLQRFSLGLIRRRADKIIVMNNSIKNKLLLREFNEKKIYVSSNGINFDYLDSLKRDDVSYEGVFLGRLSASKGVSDFIPIWKKVCEKMPAAKLAIIGGSEKHAKADFMQKIKESGLENNIDMLGFLGDDEAFSLLKAAQVFLFPSHEEGWGIAIAEAMACGLPVVSWNLPVYKEIFEDYTITVTEGDIGLFAEKVIELLKNESLRRDRSARGRDFIKKYSWDEVAKRELEIIKI